MAKKQNNIIWILLLIAVAVYFVGPQLGLFTINNYDEQIEQAKENNNISYNVGIHFSMNTVCAGQEITGYIDSNMPGSICTLFTDVGAGFQASGTVTLNQVGSFSQSLTPQIVGSPKFKAICVLNNQYSTSNELTVTVNDCNQNQNQQTCSDTDGGVKEFLAGSVSYDGNQYNDNCKNANSLNEYYCDDLGLMSMGVLPCANGCDGGRCLTESVQVNTCADTDNGLTTNVFGTCGDNSGTPYMEDYCIGGQLVEQSCSNDNKCVAQTLSCPAGSVCDFGRCIVIPTPQQVCASNCDAIQLFGVNFNTGGCFAYNPQGALSMAAICSQNNGVYASATGCSSGDICCCR